MMAIGAITDQNIPQVQDWKTQKLNRGYGVGISHNSYQLLAV